MTRSDLNLRGLIRASTFQFAVIYAALFAVSVLVLVGVESGDAKIVAKAAELTAGATDSWDAAKRLSFTPRKSAPTSRCGVIRPS